MPRTTTSLESALPAPLAESFREQRREVRDFVRGADEAETREKIHEALTRILRGPYDLPAPTAHALARLAIDMPPPDTSVPADRALTERLALARTLARAGLASSLRPSLAAAGRGAREAFDLDRDNVLDFEDPEASGRYRPGLPPLHGQDSDITKAASSDLFERGRDT